MIVDIWYGYWESLAAVTGNDCWVPGPVIFICRCALKNNNIVAVLMQRDANACNLTCFVFIKQWKKLKVKFRPSIMYFSTYENKEWIFVVYLETLGSQPRKYTCMRVARTGHMEKLRSEDRKLAWHQKSEVRVYFASCSVTSSRRTTCNSGLLKFVMKSSEIKSWDSLYPLIIALPIALIFYFVL